MVKWIQNFIKNSRKESAIRQEIDSATIQIENWKQLHNKIDRIKIGYHNNYYYRVDIYKSLCNIVAPNKPTFYDELSRWTNSQYLNELINLFPGLTNDNILNIFTKNKSVLWNDGNFCIYHCNFENDDHFDDFWIENQDFIYKIEMNSKSKYTLNKYIFKSEDLFTMALLRFTQ